MEKQMQDKRCYLVGGLGCSGKSTFAKKLATELKIPYFKIDDIYYIVGQNLGIKPDKLVYAPMASTWENPSVLDLPDFGIYGSMRECVKQAYLEFFSYNIPQSFVMEGEALFWNEHERTLVEEILNDYQRINICLYPDYEQWLRNRTDRKNEGGHLPMFRTEDEYHTLYQDYRANMPKRTILIRDILNTDCSLMGGTNYQEDEFSNPKWEVFDFPKNMKGKTFFDIGCNTGWFSKKAFDCGAEVEGIDVSWQVLAKAYELVPEGVFNLSKVEDFPIFKYDYILCSSAFHYFSHREDVLKRISQATDYFILELPLLAGDEMDIQFDDSYQRSFCTLITEPLLLSWLNKYFKKVEKIGETIQPNGTNRPVYKCTN